MPFFYYKLSDFDGSVGSVYVWLDCLVWLQLSMKLKKIILGHFNYKGKSYIFMYARYKSI